MVMTKLLGNEVYGGDSWMFLDIWSFMTLRVIITKNRKGQIGDLKFRENCFLVLLPRNNLKTGTTKTPKPEKRQCACCKALCAAPSVTFVCSHWKSDFKRPTIRLVTSQTASLFQHTTNMSGHLRMDGGDILQLIQHICIFLYSAMSNEGESLGASFKDFNF